MKKKAVMDASATGCWLLDEDKSGFSELIIEDVFSGNIQLIQPLIWPYEIINMIRSAVIIKKRINEDEGKRLLYLWKELPVEYEEYEKLNEFEVLNYALQYQLTAYDTVYFNLAEKRGVELFTEDRNLLKLKENFSWIKSLKEYE